MMKKSSVMSRSKEFTFPVVGVGASAGGLAAFTEFLKALPVDTGMAFVLVQHLDPTHKSRLTEILSRVTRMPVHEVKRGMVPVPDCVYIAPPDKNIALSSGRFSLMDRASRSVPPRAVDFFLSSLAKEKGSQAIGVILSGAGSDGSGGQKAVKLHGGITFSQDPVSAENDSMPRSAIALKCIDHVLSPKAIAKKIVQLSRRLPLQGNKMEGIERLLLEAKGELEKIFVLLKYHAGVDFTHYKKTTLERRIKRRMGLKQKTTLKEYYKHLYNDPKEVEALFQDLLINVTNFFRDPKLFQVLQKKVFPAILRRKPVDRPVRIWVPACSTGEEVYSLAICLYESLGSKAGSRPVQVFATDVNAAVIEKARRGFYPESIKADVPPEIIRRYFIRETAGYRIAKSIRDMCVFAEQDLISDPPFSKLDLISCRNMLIYMDQDLQKKIIPLFYYALNPSGTLVLGSAETVSSFSDLFNAADKKLKIYIKKESSAKPPGRFDPDQYAVGRAVFDKRQGFSDKKLGIVLDDVRDDDVQARDEELRSALEEIQSANEELQSSNEELETSKEELQATNEELGTLNDELLSRNAELATLTGDMLNLFNSTRMPVIMVGRDLCIHRFTPMAQKVWNIIPSDVGRRVTDINPNVKIPNLEEMLLDAIEHLKMVEMEVRDKGGRWYSMAISPYKTVDNKIDGAVIALADIHTIKVAQEKCAAIGEYFESIVQAVPESLLVLEKGLHVKTANRSFYQQFKVLPGDVQGKLIYELGNHQWDIPALRKALREVLSKNVPLDGMEINHEFTDIGERTILLSARIIVENEAGERMILVGVKDITDKKKAEEKIVQLSSFPELNPSPVYEIDFNGRIVYANPAAVNVAGKAKVLPFGDGSRELVDIFRHSGKKQMTREVLIGGCWYLQSIYKVPGVDALRIYNIDIDARKKTQEALRESDVKFSHVFANMDDGVAIYKAIDDGRDFVFVDLNRAGQETSKVVKEEIVGRRVTDVFPGIIGSGLLEVFSRVWRTGVAEKYPLFLYKDTHVQQWVENYVYRLPSGLIVAIYSDVTSRQQAQESLRLAKERAEQANVAKGEFLNNIAHDFRTPLHAIMGFSSFLASEPLTEKQKKFADIINENSRGLLLLVEDLLDVSRLESGKIELRSLEFDLKACVQASFDLARLSLLGKDVTMSCAFEEVIPKIKGDAVRLGQILSNLLGNAVKYTDAGQIMVNVVQVHEGVPEGKCRIKFSVKDTGLGVSQESQEKIFDAFMRFHEFEGGEKRGGVGLGLYITKTLVNMMKGKISVTSEVGVGSEFVVVIDFDKSVP